MLPTTGSQRYLNVDRRLQKHEDNTTWGECACPKYYSGEGEIWTQGAVVVVVELLLFASCIVKLCLKKTIEEFDHWCSLLGRAALCMRLMRTDGNGE